MNPTLRIIAAATASLTLVACGGSINQPVEIPDGTKDAAAAKTVNGAIRVGDDVTVTTGSFRSVNGPATIGSRTTIPAVSLVNGSIRVGEDSVTGELTTVNGSVTVGARTRVETGIGTVNGSVTLPDGAVVNGDVTAVNGRVTLDGATINGNLENVNGGAQLLGAAVLDGDLLVRRPRGINTPDRPPEVVIGPDARVTGRLVFEREVVLRIHRRAQVGEIVGAEPEYFDDDSGADGG